MKSYTGFALQMVSLTMVLFLFLPGFVQAQKQKDYLTETKEAKDQRMDWWREARFGMFIHWGLYAIPAGEWGGKTHYGEWIRHTAQIPLETYDQFVNQFNPEKFDAGEWVRMAKDAGMKYLVITSKHHDGFCLFDSKYTDFDVMSTPFKRDILKELSEACKKQGIKLCFYHSIMDWHHPDYLPRRNWENTRSAKRANFDRYVKYMKSQLEELCTKYDALGVLWFDGEWENTWNDKRGTDLYNFVRNLQPNIIINNRVGAAREGMEGTTAKDRFGGDFGTPEQQIPATGLPGVDWETCMTMNDNWGYNKADKNFKSSKELIQKLADISSKGGNFLLNVGPTAEGLFPDESIQILKEIGEWMKYNSESIYGTQASPFEALAWGRCTQKFQNGNTLLYLHVFERPESGRLLLNGIGNEPVKAWLLIDKTRSPIDVKRQGDALSVLTYSRLPDDVNTVMVLEVKGPLQIYPTPKIVSKFDQFIDTISVVVEAPGYESEIRYTLDGTEPTIHSPLWPGAKTLSNTATVSVRAFLGETPLSGAFRKKFNQVIPLLSTPLTSVRPGLQFSYFEGEWEKLPDFETLQALKTGIANNISLSGANEVGENYGFEFKGYIKVPQAGIYNFFTSSDDGSQLWIDDELVVDNDGLHGLTEKSGTVPLLSGYHEIRIRFFQRSGGHDLKISWESEAMAKQTISDHVLFYTP